ncbi:hypothetical protein FOCG_18271 [Fusarium oxysporum f. sp. radicis-lycopersici 26381]|nr:hypothetical protein FOCG_18271 [Fusarium oxysporum f. sp. radicis-lycopersici 26381]
MNSRHETNNNGDGSVSSVDAVYTQTRPLASPQDLPVRKILPLRFGGGHFRFWIAKAKEEGSQFTIVTETERKAVGSADLQEFLFSMHKDTHYKNCRFLQVQDLTTSDSKIFITYQYLPVSLAELCGSPGLDDQDMAGILKPVIAPSHEITLTANSSKDS